LSGRAISVSPAVLFFNDPPTSEIYTLSLHDALPISAIRHHGGGALGGFGEGKARDHHRALEVLAGVVDVAAFQLVLVGKTDRMKDRKSTRLNSSHVEISYAVFCLKKKNNQIVIVLLR